MWVWETVPQIHQLSYHPGTHPELRAGSPQHLPNLWPARVCEGASPGEPELRDHHDWGQQPASQEKFQWGSSINGGLEARDLEPEQQLIAMDIWHTMWHSTALEASKTNEYVMRRPERKGSKTFAVCLFVRMFCRGGNKGEGWTWKD